MSKFTKTFSEQFIQNVSGRGRKDLSLLYVPLQNRPSPEYPGKHLHSNEPWLSQHFASAAQSSSLSLHSFISMDLEVIMK